MIFHCELFGRRERAVCWQIQLGKLLCRRSSRHQRHDEAVLDGGWRNPILRPDGASGHHAVGAKEHGSHAWYRVRAACSESVTGTNRCAVVLGVHPAYDRGQSAHRAAPRIEARRAPAAACAICEFSRRNRTRSRLRGGCPQAHLYTHQYLPYYIVFYEMRMVSYHTGGFTRHVR